MTSGDANDRLENAFMELINEKPFAKITVNDIVERAGVHRNTFYYHYQSIPGMLGEICRKDVAKIFLLYKDVSSPNDCILHFVKYCLEHKEALLNVYNSEAKPIMMTYVKQIGRFSIDQYIDNVTERTGISRADREIMAHFFTAGIVGIWTDWVEDGITKDSSDDFIRIGNMLEKLTLETLTA